MDEQTLSLLLECPICLNILDENNRVLPCQHTFCGRCLEDIYAKRCELNCPECRTTVTTAIKDLPRNILLVRLLEVMKSRRNSNTDISMLKTSGFTKSCPASPGYTLAATSFQLNFSGQRKQSLSHENLGQVGNHFGQVAADGNTLTASQSLFAKESISPITDSLGTSNQVIPGIRLSRTTIDLVSAAAKLAPLSEAAQGESTFFLVPPETATAAVSTGQSSFSQSGWRSAPRNRSLPTNKDPVGFAYRSHAMRTASPVERAVNRRSHNALGSEDSTEFVKIAFPNMSRSPNHLKPSVGIASNYNSTNTPEISPPKESRSFINKIFRVHSKSHDFHPSSVADQLKNLSVADSTMIDNTMEDGKSKKVVGLSAFRQHRSFLKPTTTFECWICRVPYPARNHYELDLRLNDLLYVHQKHSDGWMRATHERTGRNGLIPVASVERLHGNSTSD